MPDYSTFALEDFEALDFGTVDPEEHRAIFTALANLYTRIQDQRRLLRGEINAVLIMQRAQAKADEQRDPDLKRKLKTIVMPG